MTDHRLTRTGDGAVVCTAQDITGERVGQNDKVGGFDRLLDSLTEHAFYTLNHEGHVTRWNEGASQMSGYEADEIFGEHLTAFFTEEDRQAGVPEQLLETARKNGSTTKEGWRVRHDGSRFWTDETIAARLDTVGTLRGYGTVTTESTAPMTAR